MAGTVTTDLIFFTGSTVNSLSDCDYITDWLTAPTTSTAFFLQGIASNSLKVSNGLVTSVFTLYSTVNLTGKIIYVWMFMSELKKMDTEANGGLRIRIEQGTNWREWYVGGIDTYIGGWKCFAIRADYGWTTQSATAPDITVVTKVGVACKTTAVATVVNFWWDAMRYGTGISIKGGISTDVAKFDDIITAEGLVANKWGVVSKVEGMYIVQGKLTFGSTVAGEATYFKDTSKVVIFGDRPFSTFYEVTIQGNSTATTKVYFGSKSGTSGISGCVFRSVGASKYNFTATDINITDLGIYGCSFFDADVISLPAASASKEILNSTLEQSAQALVNTCAVAYSNFISADNKAFRITGSNFLVSGSSIISCPTGSEITTAGEYTFDALKFLGNTIDVENSSTGLVTINCVRGSDPSPSKVANTGAGSSTSIVNTVTLSVTVKDESGTVITGSRVSIEDINYVSMKGAVADDGGVQTDETTAANNATANDMTLLPASGTIAIGDAYYFGSPEPFFNLRINIGTNGVGNWAIAWEYYNGTWASLTVTDGTNGFKAGTGNKEVTFDPPNDWATTTVQNINAFWIRARVTTGDASPTTRPLGTQSWIKEQIMNELTNASGVAEETDFNYPGSAVSVTIKIRKSTPGETRYYPASTNQTIGSSGLTLSWTLIRDIVL